MGAKRGLGHLPDRAEAASAREPPAASGGADRARDTSLPAAAAAGVGRLLPRTGAGHADGPVQGLDGVEAGPAPVAGHLGSGSRHVLAEKGVRTKT